jgi:hypothetical protein
MSAPLKNQFWKLRSKHGRDVIFKTPEALWQAACEYFEATDERKWTKKDWVGKDATLVTRETDTPYTLRGLCIFLDVNSGYWSEFKATNRAKELDFTEIITRIEDVIYNQKFEGASVGAFNASIIARDLGLKEQTDITTQGEKIAPVITAMVDGKIIDGEMK